MPTRDQRRLSQDRAHPRLMELWWALRPLTSVVRFMQTGAHPDDEISGMLAALALRDGINISYACSTRGEGGQNDIGTEAGIDLGALRTREMERACDVLGMRMYWHSTHPEDTITDFGFSKSGEETLERWGRDRTMSRFVEIIRTEKPDIICPTFLDVPGQHGHHRAMTEAAHAVMAAAADPTLPSNLPPWQVKKMYLPAWSGAGQSYDDDLPPPLATMTVQGTDREPMTGWNWNRIGQHSRAFHRTQGMGRWEPAGAGQDWPLHLAETHLNVADDTIWSGLPSTLASLSKIAGAEPIASSLQGAQTAINAAIAAFPDFRDVADHTATAVNHVQTALEECPVEVAADVRHRLEAKLLQLGHVLRLSLGVEAHVAVASEFVEQGEATAATLAFDPGMAESAEAVLDLPKGWTYQNGQIIVSGNAATSDPYRAQYDPLEPKQPCIQLSLSHSEASISVPLRFETEPVVLPRERVALTPRAAILNTRNTHRSIVIEVSDLSPADASVELDVPVGWRAERLETGFRVTAPEDVSSGRHQISARVEGKQAKTVRQIDYDHIAPTALGRRALVTIGIFDVVLPDVKVGYVGAGNDRVGDWLCAMGADVTALEDAQLSSDGALSEFDAIVVGIFAMRFRPGLVEALPAIHRWTEKGGTLVTLYHRPWDNWDPETVPLKRLEIGQPSLRWRVTDEKADVNVLREHPILAEPNPIAAEDWNGWAKERGLYFAKSWDPAYAPLLSMADKGEEPLEGALLVADIGQGRHIHTSLILHHQMENLVPGAFRLMANFIARRA